MRKEDLLDSRLESFRAGDPEGLGRLLSDLQGPVYGIAFRYTRHRETAVPVRNSLESEASAL